VRSDRVVWLGGDSSGKVFKQQLPVIDMETGKKGVNGQSEVLLLVNDRTWWPWGIASLC
jgi:hypothetical protein